MGNKESKSEYGTILVHTDQPFCISGQAVTGNVHIQINKPFLAKSLVLELAGKEKCKWYVQKQRIEGEGEEMHVVHYEEKYSDKKDIIEFETTLVEFGEEILAVGQYTFPFSFNLPADCPASTYYTGSMKSIAYVKYKCKAKLDGHDDNKIKFKSGIVVRQMNTNGSGNLKGSEEVEIKKC